MDDKYYTVSDLKLGMRATADQLSHIVNKYMILVYDNDDDDEEAETTDMCYAMQTTREAAEERGKIKTLVSLVRDGLLDIAEAAKRAGISVEEMKSML